MQLVLPFRYNDLGYLSFNFIDLFIKFNDSSIYFLESIE